MTDTSTKRICLWSGPRNISTALMYSFAQRPDTRVYDEPLYGYYLKTTNAKEYHPGAAEVMADMECDGQKVVEMMMATHEKPVVFFKNMGHHLGDLDRSFMLNAVNLILTRHPAQVITSFAIGAAAGLAVGALLGWSRWAERLVGPTFHTLKQISLFAWIPMLSMWFGLGDAAGADDEHVLLHNGTNSYVQSSEPGLEGFQDRLCS